MRDYERSSPSGTRVLLPIVGIAIAVIIALVVTLLCGGDASNNQGATATTTPDVQGTAAAQAGGIQQALTQFVQGTLQAEYVGDCSQAQTGGSAGKVCSIARGERQNVHAFMLGPPLAEPNQWALVEERSGAWQVSSAPRITADTRLVPGIPWPLRTGADVVVIGTGNCLNIRTEPRIAPGNAVDCIAEGTVLKLTTGPIEANDTQWWQIEGRTGWVSADYLRYPDATQ